MGKEQEFAEGKDAPTSQKGENVPTVPADSPADSADSSGPGIRVVGDPSSL